LSRQFSKYRRTSWDTVEPQIARLFGDKSFSDLKVPLAVSAIDFKARRTGVIEKGKLKDSLKAKHGFPGILPPVVSGKMELVSSTVYSQLRWTVLRRKMRRHRHRFTRYLPGKKPANPAWK